MRQPRTFDFTPSSGNVFEDLGLPDAAERLARAELSRVIAQIIGERKWSQKKAADVLGMDVRIQVGPRARGKAHADVSVERVANF